LFIMRFDMRSPSMSPASDAELYAAALDMAEWGEQHGCLQLVVSEHHASEDGYLPAPLILASAMAGRTRKTAIQVAALILPLHDPLALAESMAVLDIASHGRVSYVVAIGYRPEEYAMFGRDFASRGNRMEECLAALKQAWTGQPFEFEGRTVRVTPTPLSPRGPGLLMGGNSAAAAKRAARFGLGMLAQGTNPELSKIYERECEKFGMSAPGPCINPPTGTVTSAFISKDPDRAWAELGPYLLHDAQAYAAWLGEHNRSVTKSVATTIDELRVQNGAYRIFTPNDAVAHIKQSGILLTQPLCGGMPPDLAWPSLELMASDVLPRI
jgi:alkanesulfonate monooxygenase SsuD/methylene tetrahydromethanopterin reductase-like flavin-dependent oxidoreductase (luciferase family)